MVSDTHDLVLVFRGPSNESPIVVDGHGSPQLDPELDHALHATRKNASKRRPASGSSKPSLVFFALLWISVVLAGGPALAQGLIQVPDVRGLQEDPAITLLETVGLEANRQGVLRLTLPAGEVIDQDPAPGTQVPVGEEIDLQVSVSGPPDPLEIPASWAGEWEFTVGFENVGTGNLGAVDQVTDVICPGDPVGLALAEELLDELPQGGERGFGAQEPGDTRCTGEVVGERVELLCVSEVTFDTCSLTVELEIAAERAAQEIIGEGQWQASGIGDCQEFLEIEGEGIAFIGDRVGTDLSSCSDPTSSFVQKFVRHPFVILLDPGRATEVACVADLAARPKSGQVQLTWTHTGAASYSVYRSTVAGGPYDFIADTTSTYSTYLDTDVVNGTTYDYVVREVEEGRERCESNEASATPMGRRGRR